MQTPDSLAETTSGWRAVTEREPTKKELEDLFFAWKAVKHVKSNAIMLVKDSTVVGMGAGQPSRVVSVEIALKKAGERAKGSVLGSDAFFPFPDGVELAGKGGVTAIVEPGGSVRDEEAIKVANKYKMAMVFTGVRHFRH
jgi:phosphoribosylaminoimidazolecarboxamide formyltransferase/IMP cyclohydrolase